MMSHDCVLSGREEGGGGRGREEKGIVAVEAAEEEEERETERDEEKALYHGWLKISDIPMPTTLPPPPLPPSPPPSPPFPSSPLSPPSRRRSKCFNFPDMGASAKREERREAEGSAGRVYSLPSLLRMRDVKIHPILSTSAEKLRERERKDPSHAERDDGGSASCLWRRNGAKERTLRLKLSSTRIFSDVRLPCHTRWQWRKETAESNCRRRRKRVCSERGGGEEERRREESDRKEGGRSEVQKKKFSVSEIARREHTFSWRGSK